MLLAIKALHTRSSNGESPSEQRYRTKISVDRQASEGEGHANIPIDIIPSQFALRLRTIAPTTHLPSYCIPSSNVSHKTVHKPHSTYIEHVTCHEL